MERESFFIKREAFIKGSGKIIICMDMENCIILITSQPIRAIGSLISFMVKAKCTTTSLHLFMVSLTIQTLKIYNKNGDTMKEIQSVIQSKGKERLCFQTANIMKDSLEMIKLMVRESFTLKMDRLLLESGRILGQSLNYEVLLVF